MKPHSAPRSTSDHSNVALEHGLSKGAVWAEQMQPIPKLIPFLSLLTAEAGSQSACDEWAA